jgi:hypothetical protein
MVDLLILDEREEFDRALDVEDVGLFLTEVR